MLTYGSKMRAEMRIMGRKTGYTHLRHNRKSDIMKELNAYPIMKFTENCSSKWNVPLGRTFPRCHQTVTGPTTRRLIMKYIYKHEW
jgi:hypothetical protein